MGKNTTEDSEGCWQTKQADLNQKNVNIVPSGFAKLDEWAAQCIADRPFDIGYPGNQDTKLESFYKWYTANNIERMMINNAGDPFDKNIPALCAASFERDVIMYFANKYDFDNDNVWGIVTSSGSDGNNHAIYFGANKLRHQTGKAPIVYVSDEAHYSNRRLCDLQNIELRIVKSNDYGQMIPEELEKVIDPLRPCIIVFAMGSTLLGAIDDQEAINRVLEKYPDMPVHRHVDAALFGGYLPFTQHRDLVSHRKMKYDSIAISGHKFFGIDSPCGLFLTTRDVYDSQASYDITYLNANMRMINCSRSGIQPLKFWWLINTVGDKGWTEQAAQIMENTEFLKTELKRIGWPYWNNKYSNTVLLRRPSDIIIKKYNLACGVNEAWGGQLSHVVVMQHVTKDTLRHFIADLEAHGHEGRSIL